MEFSNKVVLVTGAASGIGLATAKQFHRLGATVILADKNQDNLEKAARNFTDRDLSLKVDLENESEVEGLVEEIRSRFDRLDVLVNNAGFIRDGGVEKFSLSELDSMYNVMVRAAYQLTSSCVHLLKSVKGCVVNVSSVGSTKAGKRFIGYRMMKASVDAFTRCAALELSAHGIRVNSVNPGTVATPILQNSGVPGSIEATGKRIPLKRQGKPEDISEIICFLASEKASYVTGMHLVSDGGISLANEY